MPFDTTSPALSGDAYKVLVDFVERTFSSDQKTQFYVDSRRTKEEWLSMKRRSHGDYANLVGAFYTIMGEKNPELLYNVYEAIGTTNGSPVRTLAKILGSAPAVVQASAFLSSMFNDDSRIKVHNLRNTGATIEQTVLGPSELAYPEQVFGAMGYYRGIAPLFDLKTIDAELRMLSIPLQRLLREYAPDFSFEEDGDGNLYSEGNLFAKNILYAQSERAFYGLPQQMWKNEEGKVFIGTLNQRSGKTRLALEDILLLKTVRGLENDGVPFVHEGTLFGGKHPAPTNVYDLSWEAKGGIRQKVWLFLSDAYARLFESGHTVAAMASLADNEAERRGRAEEEISDLITDLRRTTQEAINRLEERRRLIDQFRDSLHDIVHEVNKVGAKTYGFMLPMFQLVGEDLSEIKQRELFSGLSTSEIVNGFEQNYGFSLGENNKKRIMSIDAAEFLVYLTSLSEVKGPNQEKLSNLVEKCKIVNRQFNGIEEFIRKFMLQMDQETSEAPLLDYRTVWQRVLHKQRSLQGRTKITLEIDEKAKLKITPRLNLAIENLALNALEAASTKDRGYVKIKAKIIDFERLETIIINSAQWSSEKDMSEVVSSMGSVRLDRFSTKTEGNNRGIGLVIIKEGVRSMGGSYQVNASYINETLIQRIIFPKECTTN